MSGYRFRLCFRLPEDEGIGCDTHEREVASSAGIRYVLNGEGRDRPEYGGEWLVLEGMTFSDEQSAEDAGVTAQDALRWCSVFLRLGMDVGRGKLRGTITKQGETRLRELSDIPEEKLIRSEVHG